ncbi:MAG: ABC transporter ATP-binding protein [Arcobacter sp.]|nr:ABC transporter ATP-binding protein [Arcobacter sp.]|tara:strand:+ start:10857 stop:11576 length:720 start_codon:yes stop_codon:yes gene_type:complete
MTNQLEIKNVSYKYDKDLVLKNINLNIKQASFLVLLGLNGAGKSTLFALITRLLKLQEGEIFINSFPISNYKKALENIGIVFQEPTLDLDLTVKQNLIFYGSLKGISFKETMNSIKDELKTLELEEKLNVKVRSLNGGHRRRVEILRALINNPKLLLLDEATSGLDIKSRYSIISYVKDIVKKRGISVLWITHLFDEIAEEDDVAIIKKGQIVASGIVKDVIKENDKTSLTEVFEYLTK